MKLTFLTRASLLGSPVGRRTVLALMLAAVPAASLVALPSPASAEAKTIKVGIVSGEDEDVWKVVTAEAAKQDLTIETVVFNDDTQPNEAMERGEIDADLIADLEQALAS